MFGGIPDVIDAGSAVDVHPQSMPQPAGSFQRGFPVCSVNLNLDHTRQSNFSQTEPTTDRAAPRSIFPLDLNAGWLSMKFKTKILAVAVLAVGSVSVAWAAGKEIAPKSVDWSFNGPFGTFDRAQLKRGWLVYSRVCAGCHGLRHLYFRNLLSVGITPKEMQEMMENREVRFVDDAGDPQTRPSRLTDKIRSPFANIQAAKAANSGKAPPDLTLMVKARSGGADYVFSLLMGYVSAEACAKQFKASDGTPLKPEDGQHCNTYYPGHIIAMAPPLLSDGLVEYPEKGAPKSTIQQMAMDVTAFLAWAAEPEMEQRKRIGIRAMLFLLVLTLLFFVIYRQVWKPIKNK